MTIVLSYIRRNIRSYLLVIWTILVVFHIFAVAYPESMFGYWFDLDTERNISTAINALLWFVAGAVAFLHGLYSKRHKSLARWGLFGLFFVYIAADEALILHERVAQPVRDILGIGQGSILYHAWIVVAVIFIIGLSILYLYIKDRRYISQLEKKTCKLVLFTGVGVVALEAIGTQIYLSQIAYKLGPVLIEESFEIGMASLITYRLLVGLRLPLAKKL